MSYRDPRCVHIADTLGGAELVASWLIGQDIPAEVMSRNTLGGFEGISVFTPGGVSSRGIEVWVLDPDHVPQAIQLLAEKEMQRQTRTAAREATGSPIDVVCEDCGKLATFPPAQAGSVQDCPHCGAYIDVGDEMEAGEESAEEDESPASDGIRLPPHVRPDEGD